MHYAAAKAGYTELAQALFKRVGSRGLTIHWVVPGAIVTQQSTKRISKDVIARFDNVPLGRKGTAGNVAHAVAFLMDCPFWLRYRPDVARQRRRPRLIRASASFQRRAFSDSRSKKCINSVLTPSVSTSPTANRCDGSARATNVCWPKSDSDLSCSTVSSSPTALRM